VWFLAVDAARTEAFGLSSSSIIGLLVCGAADASAEDEGVSVVVFRPGLW
jgi:hypothetical protein